VTVDTSGGTPRIALTVGGSTVYANYASGSGSTALVFSYTVQAGDTDADGIAVGALQANGGTLKDTAGNGMTLALNSVGSTSSVLVDTTAPTVASVSVPADGTYHTGQNIDFTVNFSEAVTVDTTGGTPRIAVTLDTGGTVYADYQSGSGTSAVVFRYTVGSGTMDNTGITVGALGANGGTLRDAAGNDATLTLNSVGSTAAVNVDGSQPHVLDVSSTTANASYGVGATVSVSVTFSTAVAVDTSGGTPTLALADGGVATYSTGSGSSTLVFTYHVAGGENTTDLDYASTGALALNGGTIKDSGGSHVDALLTLATPGAAHSLGANKDIVIDTTPPAITFTNLAFSHDTGASDTDFVTDVASQTITATLSGAPASGDIVYGSLDNGATWSNITGKVSGTTLTWDNVTLSGNGTLKLKVTDSVGNDGAVAVQAYTLWSGAPSLTFSKLSLSNDTGISSTDFITKAAGQTIGATLSAPLTSGDIVYGSLDGGATWTDITAKMSGTTLSWNGVTLAGSGTLMLKVTDAFGHDGAATSHAYTLDTAAPTTGVATAAFSKDTGASASDFITSATDQTVSGTLSANLAAGETVQVSLDGGATWSEASATAGQSAWSLAGQTLMSSNTLMVKVSDAAGNDGPVFSQAYVLQAEAPAIVFSGLALSDDTGVSNSDFVTRAANQTVTATLNAPLGAGDAVYGSLDGGATWTDVTAKISGTRLAWDGVVLTGNGTLMIKAVNASGTDGTAASHAYVLDTVAPNAPTVVSGDTSSVTPTLTGTASLGEGESLAVSVGGATYHVVPVNGSWRLDLGSAIPASGSLSLTVGNSYGVTATVSDAAGNTRDASGTLTIAPPPTQPANTTPLPLPVAQGANPQNPDTPAGSTENTGKPASSPPPAPVLSFTPPESPLAVSLGGNAVNSAPISQHPIDIGAGLQSAAPGFSLRTSAPAGDLTRSDGGFPIEVTAFSGSSNGGLTLNRGMSDQTISGESAVVLVPSDAFVHTDPGATVHLTAQQANGRALPSWVSFDAINGKFTVRPPAGVKGEISIKVIARDSQGREAVTTFKIKLDRNAQTHASLDHHGRAALSEQVREAANGASDRMNRLARAAEWLNS
jgi:hypothetical protein